MELTEAIRRRHMTRRFTGQPLPDGLLDTLLADAVRAPSAGHTQGWSFVVLEGPEETSRYWGAATDPAWRATSRRYEGLAKAPAIVLPLASPQAYVGRYGEPDKASSGLGPPPAGGGQEAWPVPYWFVDAAFATLLLLLRATEEGLGTAFLGAFRGERELLTALGVPGGQRLLGAVLVGRAAPDDPPSGSLARGRRPLDEVVHRGTW